jgi:hypothetical protein
MLSWEYELVSAPAHAGLMSLEAGAPEDAEALVPVLIKERTADGWAVHAVHKTRAGTHFLFRRRMPAAPDS